MVEARPRMLRPLAHGTQRREVEVASCDSALAATPTSEPGTLLKDVLQDEVVRHTRLLCLSSPMGL